MEQQQKKKMRKRRSSSQDLSFSANRPQDINGDFKNSICAVKQTRDPFVDFRQSIAEMIVQVGVHDWEDMEELVYCYLKLNSTDVHGFIVDAFLSFCSN
ncbi:Ovate family protein 4 [Zostera marina]|uniref:Transcription repressor n=1 Tax=Zostera marina TaxID=29655 RepID=A0A0K9P795_ZOSMR|nr:Ovate family protein 4 [Zostera marina]